MRAAQACAVGGIEVGATIRALGDVVSKHSIAVRFVAVAATLKRIKMLAAAKRLRLLVFYFF